ncbi:hypothetical protein [Gallaecimonas xiamenensis]|nr:hypothetical protein [Gallaecimonas xiamenensis]
MPALVRQQGLKAVLGVSLWSGPICLLWGVLYYFKPALAGIMIPLSGVLLALVVRSFSRALGGRFTALACQSYLVLVLMALRFGFAVQAPVQWALVMILGLIGLGLVPFTLRRDLLDDGAAPSSGQGDKWYLVLPLGLFGTLLSCYLAVQLLALSQG